MARKPLAIQSAYADSLPAPAPGTAAQDATELAVILHEREAGARKIAEQVGYLLPLEGVDADLIQRDVAANMRRSVDACLEVGRALLVLKAACGHGNFMARLEVLNLNHTVAKRFMQAAGKFSNGAAPHLLAAAGNQTKLFELLVLDDESIDTLEGGGEVAGLTLDKIGGMGMRELRKALREAKADAEATQKLLDAKSRQIDEAHAQLELRATLPDAELLEAEFAAVTQHMLTVRGTLAGHLRHAFGVLAGREHDSQGQESAFRIMQGVCNEIQDALDGLRAEFALNAPGSTPGMV
ncbi:MAG TPA: hypothetical protein PKD73_05950 [Burkholderiaceae bacterium]|nr:hypothetical protein [Burkholderiaceae bacterium]